jgi:hypothetical protein
MKTQTNRIMTCYSVHGDKWEAFTEDENWQAAQATCDEYVWQLAPDKKTAIAQHDAKLVAWEKDLHEWLSGETETNPNTKTY